MFMPHRAFLNAFLGPVYSDVWSNVRLLVCIWSGGNLYKMVIAVKETRVT